ncbi:hypothetical protein OEZ85_013067 [Tetradesmus obliquus]|uniref:AATF leucine zipper-containing domain-containing protein n=1 Tax=Tetradesmus obliquus TaxID=3088 RepID=A0ABY8U7F7_TETOB|nr:hypothetical protein OEZ85_013067 [Tetradesmus obliquus]
MSSQPFQQLQAHKDSVKDKLQGVLATVAKVPALIHADTSKELNTATTALVARQTAHTNTQASLEALPTELSAFDQVLDDALARSHDITSSLYCLKGFNQTSNSSSSSSSSSSEAAFKALGTAYEAGLAQVLKSSGGSGPDVAGQEDAEEWDDAAAAAAAAAAADEGGSGNDYAWWTEWEQDVSEGHIEGGAAAGGSWGRPAAAAAAAAGGSRAGAADEEEELWQLSMQELVAEVERRQSAILQPQSAEDAARTPSARQKRLRAARSVLSARMQQQRAAGLAAAEASVGGTAADGSGDVGGGGFVSDGGYGSSGWQAGVHDGWGDLKRQRL